MNPRNAAIFVFEERCFTPAVGARRAKIGSACGAVLWVATALLAPPHAALSLGTIEHVFVFLPLVAMPLALQLLFTLHDRGDRAVPRALCLAARSLPVAAVLLLGSFLVPKGPMAGGLAAPWLGVALLVATGGARRVHLRAGPHFSNVNLHAAHLFWPVGAIWLVLSRLGVAPPGFSPGTVFLAALHFHFSGFVLQILVAATGHLVPSHQAWASWLHRVLAIGVVVGIALIAAGNALASPLVKFSGVTTMVLSAGSLAITATFVALAKHSRPARGWLLVSAGSLLAGMSIAGVYGVGEWMGTARLGIPHMVTTHGILNALGFTLCGLLGHLQLRSPTPGRGEPLTP